MSWKDFSSKAMIRTTPIRGSPSSPRPRGSTAIWFSVVLRRGKGYIAPLFIERKYDDEDNAVGYASLQGPDVLNTKDRDVLDSLSLSHPFRFSDVKKALGGKSSSNTKRFLNRAIEAGVIYRVGDLYARDQV